jgi:UDP-3-O-[3-hydroxymyristoyl] glucosamine N-acyltransferase
LIGGELVGDAGQAVSGAKPLREAGPSDVTFLENDRHLPALDQSAAGAVIVPTGMAPTSKPFIQVSEPLDAFIRVVRHFTAGRAADEEAAVSPQAFVHPSAVVGAGADVAPFAVVGAGSVVGQRCRLGSGAVVGRDCRLGNDVTLHPHAVLYDRTVVGHRVTIHANAVVGADGFGYRFQGGRHVKVPQLGHVEIADDVEIGACTTIDRGTFSATRIGEGTKIDNLVMIAHNCQVGRHNIFVSQMGMAGSSCTGDYVVIAGQVGVVEHVQIGDRSVIGGQAAVTKDVPPDSRMLGSPATPEKDQKRILMSLLRLPEFRRELREVQERLGLVG